MDGATFILDTLLKLKDRLARLQQQKAAFQRMGVFVQDVVDLLQAVIERVRSSGKQWAVEAHKVLKQMKVAANKATDMLLAWEDTGVLGKLWKGDDLFSAFEAAIRDIERQANTLLHVINTAMNIQNGESLDMLVKLQTRLVDNNVEPLFTPEEQTRSDNLKRAVRILGRTQTQSEQDAQLEKIAQLLNVSVSELDMELTTEMERIRLLEQMYEEKLPSDLTNALERAVEAAKHQHASSSTDTHSTEECELCFTSHSGQEFYVYPSGKLACAACYHQHRLAQQRQGLKHTDPFTNKPMDSEFINTHRPASQLQRHESVGPGAAPAAASGTPIVSSRNTKASLNSAQLLSLKTTQLMAPMPQVMGELQPTAAFRGAATSNEAKCHENFCDATFCLKVDETCLIKQQSPKCFKLPCDTMCMGLRCCLFPVSELCGNDGINVKDGAKPRRKWWGDRLAALILCPCCTIGGGAAFVAGCIMCPCGWCCELECLHSPRPNYIYDSDQFFVC